MGARRDRRGQPDAEDEPWQRVAEPVHGDAAAHHEAAACYQRLGERADDEVDARRVGAEMLRDAAARGAQHAERVRLVHQQPAPVPLLHLKHRGQVRHVAVHAVEAFDHDQAVAVFAAFDPEYLLQVGEVVVAEHQLAGLRTGCPGEDRVVRQFVDDQQVTRAEDVADHRGVGQIAADERETGFETEERGEVGLQFLVQHPLAAHDSRGGHTDAVRSHHFLRGAEHARIFRQAEIVVVREADHGTAVGRAGQRVERTHEVLDRGEQIAPREPEAPLDEIVEPRAVVHPRLRAVRRGRRRRRRVGACTLPGQLTSRVPLLSHGARTEAHKEAVAHKGRHKPADHG